MKILLLALLLLPRPAVAKPPEPSAADSLFANIRHFLNGPARRAHRVAAVAAVRGGIPTDQGENLDQRLLDRARALRAALLRPDAAAADAAALIPVYDALAASQYVQALAVEGGPAGKAEAAAALARWADAPRAPALPATVKSLMKGPFEKIDDKTLVAAGWGGYARGLSPADARPADAKPGWAVAPHTARLDESLEAVRDTLVQKKLAPADEVKAHVLAGRLLAALAKADVRGQVDADAAASATTDPAAPEESAAPAAVETEFNPKSIYQKASKSVALILCASEEGSGELGTGSVVDSSRRRILTNAHVVIRDATRQPWPVIHVYFKPARMTGDPKQDMRDPVEGRVIAFDRALDLALVEVSRLPEDAQDIGLDDPRAVSVGDRVAAIGHPEQGGLWTLTTGVISTVVADVGGIKGKNAFQTDTSINRGNSGGPLLDANGRIVGVNTSMARKAADGLAITSVNFAIRSDVARRWMAAQNEAVAFGGGSVPPDADRVAMNAPAPAPSPAPAPAPRRAPRPVAAAAAKHVTITESKPFSREDVIAAEVAKMEEMGDEMHQEIQKKLSK
jgi:serine protease Do